MAGYMSGIPLTLGAVRGCLLCSCQWELETDLTCRTVLEESVLGFAGARWWGWLWRGLAGGLGAVCPAVPTLWVQARLVQTLP